MLSLLLLTNLAAADAPDLTDTEAAIEDCFTFALTDHTDAEISVEVNGTGVISDSSNLSEIYALLASTAEGDQIIISSNTDGDAALATAQVCLENWIPTVGMARVYQARADLRHELYLLETEAHTYSTFELDLENNIATFYEDGVTAPTCDNKVHLDVYALSSGDYSIGYAVDSNLKKKDKFECKNTDCESEEGSSCNVVTRSDGFKDCYCTATSSFSGCAGSSGTETEDFGAMDGDDDNDGILRY